MDRREKEQLMTPKDVAEYLNIKPDNINYYIRTSDFPRGVRLSAGQRGRRRWTREEIEAWLNVRRGATEKTEN